jgi:hypothetical protein
MKMLVIRTLTVAGLLATSVAAHAGPLTKLLIIINR